MASKKAFCRAGSLKFIIPEAVNEMVVNDSSGLKNRIADGCSNEREILLLQRRADRVGKSRGRRYLRYALPPVANHLAGRERPDELVERPMLFLQSKETLCIADGRFDLHAVPYDGWIGVRRVDPLAVHAGDLCRIEAGKDFSESLTFVKHGLPGQSCLERVQHNVLEPFPILMDRDPPFEIVIPHHQFIIPGPVASPPIVPGNDAISLHSEYDVVFSRHQFRVTIDRLQ